MARCVKLHACLSEEGGQPRKFSYLGQHPWTIPGRDILLIVVSAYAADGLQQVLILLIVVVPDFGSLRVRFMLANEPVIPATNKNVQLTVGKALGMPSIRRP